MMTEEYLHGTETVYLDDGDGPIEVVRASVGAMIVTAPNAQAAMKATLELGSVANSNDLKLEAIDANTQGNGISMELLAGGGPSVTTGVKVIGQAITVTLGTDANGDLNASASDIITALSTDDDASALLVATTTSNGSGLMPVEPQTYLSGGQDEAFPLGEPVLVYQKKQIAMAGDGGTLKTALTEMAQQKMGMVVVVRVEDSEDQAQLISNIIGTVDENNQHSGLQSLLLAGSKIGIKPRLITVPEYSSLPGVGWAMEAVARRLKAHCIIEGSKQSFEDVVAEGRAYTNSYYVHPKVKLIGTDGITRIRPNSATVLGHILRCDAEYGYWQSPSNRQIFINGITPEVDWISGDPLSTANLYNEKDVTVFNARDGKHFLWGNRLTNHKFFNQERIRFVVGESIELAHLDYVDRNITKPYVGTITDRIDGLIRRLVKRGVLRGGRVWLDTELNDDETIRSGKIYWNYELQFFGVAERLVFRQHINHNGYNEVLADYAA
ncbi:hypothetical protein QF117_10670 [Vibrio sp. YMD68]|uniref:phage tail sheath C-terminal domain-containing protein n=1 Tax=Vibrio sp. YMD68 TaxID=3042300 RepID=UPI00249BFEDA|nr:phage tail sheath C-terminal domain-containing protein [Vibrio sp. YMD68]WGV98820.1 hypothetical protein QF117_02340 [Vibrio sp. YMD68]WGW01253.1 hypothetical protein QF117_10670 [Vibrio sp. YMD68]